MSLQFRTHTFEQQVPDGLSETKTIHVQGFIGVGSGLGCIEVERPGFPAAYGLVHVPSGMGLVDLHFGPFAENRVVAEKWIELLDPVMDWNRPVEVISKDIGRLDGNPVMQALLEAGAGRYITIPG